MLASNQSSSLVKDYTNKISYLIVKDKLIIIYASLKR
jgi:hypothetical protein